MRWDTGAGWGLILTYAAYMRRNEDTALNAFLLPAANNFVSLCAGMMVFCTVFTVVPQLVASIATNPAALTDFPDLQKAIAFAQEKFGSPALTFRVGDAMATGLAPDSVDVAICAHVYEHVSSAQQMMDEILRVLRPGGVCYFAAENRIIFREGDYRLPFLSLLPKPLAHRYLQLTGRGDHYYETLRTVWQLRRLTNKFDVLDYTRRVVQDPGTLIFNAQVWRPPEAYRWGYTHVKRDLWLVSIAGGTDLAGAFLTGLPTLPVYEGEMQCRALGLKVEAWDDDGRPVIGEVGELVCTEPFPSMPLRFWNVATASLRPSLNREFPRYPATLGSCCNWPTTLSAMPSDTAAARHRLPWRYRCRRMARG